MVIPWNMGSISAGTRPRHRERAREQELEFSKEAADVLWWDRVSKLSEDKALSLVDGHLVQDGVGRLQEEPRKSSMGAAQPSHQFR